MLERVFSMLTKLVERFDHNSSLSVVLVVVLVVVLQTVEDEEEDEDERKRTFVLRFSLLTR